MKQYNRIMLGKGGKYAKMCRREGYIGSEFEVMKDLTGSLYENWREFNKEYIPQWMSIMPGKTKTAAGLVCGFTWTIVKGLQKGDIVLCPSGEGYYYVGTIESDYYFVPDTELPHRRRVEWMDKVIPRKEMSVKLQNSSGSIGTCCNLTKYAEELERLINDRGKIVVEQDVKQEPHQEKKKDYMERDLHKLFCTWLRNEDIYAKTIYHEKTKKGDNSAMTWVHPDIIGAKFENIENEATFSLLKAIEPKETVNLYSFELKRRIENDSQLKEYYFQALSNSSWANYGYLVAFEINETLNEEMGRLNSSFGIGIIQLSATDYTVLYPAKEHPLDYRTIDKLTINPNFKDFISKLSKYLNAPKNYTTDSKRTFEDCCDDIFNSEDEVDEYCKAHNIPIL